jgi:hypothetical protein
MHPRQFGAFDAPEAGGIPNGGVGVGRDRGVSAAKRGGAAPDRDIQKASAFLAGRAE